jgi:hypothetical protein
LPEHDPDGRWLTFGGEGEGGAERARNPSAVVPANAGTHTPRLLVSITGVSGILDRPLSRAMTVESVANI